MKIRKYLTYVAVISTLAVISIPAHALHAWGDYHWARSSNPLLLHLGDNVNSIWDGHLDLASDDWNQPSEPYTEVLHTTVVEGSTKPRQCRAQTGNVQVCNLRYGNTGWLGIAGISVSGSHITAGYVKVNDTYFDTASYNTPEWRQLVMCQEVGHTFGLGHQDEDFNNKNLGTCMDYTSEPIQGIIDNTKPNAHDYELLQAIYAETDSDGGGGGGCNPRSPKCNSGASAADVLAGLASNGPADWGRLISEHGPVEVYEINLGARGRILTHVTWTLERSKDNEN
jgi:hypothetical protein